MKINVEIDDEDVEFMREKLQEGINLNFHISNSQNYYLTNEIKEGAKRTTKILIALAKAIKKAQKENKANEENNN